jgi:IS5 family transposase
LGVWTEYDKKVYSFAEFRESDLKRREVYSIKEWANQEDDIKDLTAFKEKNWNSRQQYKLANWKLTKEKIKSFEQTLDVDRPKR